MTLFSMALYDFSCIKHGIFEARVPMGTRTTRCAKCTLMAERVWSTQPPAVVYKGEGFTKQVKE